MPEDLRDTKTIDRRAIVDADVMLGR
jgi:hypothetical protein